MKIERSYIYLRDVRFHAFHGVTPIEKEVGSDFTVSVRVAVDVSAAVEHDNVDVTLNYASLYEVIKREMMIPSNLIEHVAARIGKAIFETFPQVEVLDISLMKINPPMGADCEGAGVELHLINDKTQ
ncbi:MAG: dihydroneopterin aldolase [Prevotella sp.]|nr:dihydroneopterin aldolase [Prevotella sp.]